MKNNQINQVVIEENDYDESCTRIFNALSLLLSESDIYKLNEKKHE